jgi:hypothetical protein
MAVEVDMVGFVRSVERLSLSSERGGRIQHKKEDERAVGRGFEYQGTVPQLLCPYQTPREKWLG